jgi:hypothetical protein
MGRVVETEAFPDESHRHSGVRQESFRFQVDPRRDDRLRGYTRDL